MKYKLVNKELRIFSCSVSDLTMQQVTSFLEQWDHDAKIGELTLFYEKKTDSLVLNRDNKNYDTYLEIAEAYLKLDDEKLEELPTQGLGGMEETIDLLQQCRQRRKALQLLKILDLQGVKGFAGTKEYVVFKELSIRFSNRDDLPFLLSYIFNYGFIQGKRAERARKKK